MVENYKTDDFIWGQMKNYPPWPGKIMLGLINKDPPSKKRDFRYVYFFGYDNHNWVPVNKINKYIDHVREFSKEPSRKNQYFTAALNYIHEQYWSLQELKREDPLESGYNLDSDDENEFVEEDKKAGRNWQQRRKERQLYRKKYSKRGLIKKKTTSEVVEVSKFDCDCKFKGDRNEVVDENVDISCHVPFVKECCLPTFTENPDLPLEIRENAPDGETLQMLPNIFGVTHCVYLDKCSENSVIFDPKAACTTCNVTFGFIGVGNLNQLIFLELLKVKHTVNLWTKISYKYEKFENLGAIRTHTPEQAIVSSDIIFCSLPDFDVSKNFAFVRAGIYDGFDKSRGNRKIYVSVTCFHESADEELFKAITKLGAIYFEIKVYIPKEQEQKLSPILLCAGDTKIYKEIKPYLLHVSEDIHYFGHKFGSASTLRIPSCLAKEVFLDHANDAMQIFHSLGYKFTNLRNNTEECKFYLKSMLSNLKESSEDEKPVRESKRCRLMK